MKVTVKGVVISIEVVASTTGMQLRGVDGLSVVVPELEVKLSRMDATGGTST